MPSAPFLQSNEEGVRNSDRQKSKHRVRRECNKLRAAGGRDSGRDDGIARDKRLDIVHADKA